MTWLASCPWRLLRWVACLRCTSASFACVFFCSFDVRPARFVPFVRSVSGMIRPLASKFAGVVGAVLTVELTLETTNLLGFRLQRRAEGRERSDAGRGHDDRQDRGTRVQSHHPLARTVLLFAKRLPVENELDAIAGLARALTSDQAHVLDRVLQAVGHDGIVYVDDGTQREIAPNNVVPRPADAGRVGLALDRRKGSFRLVAWTPLLPNGMLLGSLEGTGGDSLDGVSVEVVAQPGVGDVLGGPGVERVRAEPDGIIGASKPHRPHPGYCRLWWALGKCLGGGGERGLT